jgi:hypothetical protein
MGHLWLLRGSEERAKAYLLKALALSPSDMKIKEALENLK